MPRRANARIAGIAFLSYIALGITSMVLWSKATAGNDTAATLVSIALHATDARLAALLTLVSSFCALVLAATLYALTRDQDPDVAMLGLTFRVGEGVIGGMSIHRSLGLVWLATASGASTPNIESARALGSFLLHGQGSGSAGLFFAVGGTCFSWLLLRGRMIPAPLAWLGVAASILAVVGLPLQLLEVLSESATWFIWIPMAAFEVPLAVWLILKGAAPPSRSPSA